MALVMLLFIKVPSDCTEDNSTKHAFCGIIPVHNVEKSVHNLKYCMSGLWITETEPAAIYSRKEFRQMYGAGALLFAIISIKERK